MLEEALRNWNPWWAGGVVPPALLGRPRDLPEDLSALLKLPHLILLTGVRRAGKTTVAYQIATRFLERGGRPDHVVYANLEDPAFAATNLDAIVAEHRRIFDPRGRVLLILDEVQVAASWERTVLGWYEQKRPIKVIATGSSSTLVGGPLAALLTGRNVSFPVSILSFREFLSFRDVKAPSSAGTRTERSDRLVHHLDSYLAIGGFPEVVLAPAVARRRMLQTYFSDLLFRDVVTRHGTDARRTMALAIHALENSGNLCSLRKLAAASGISPEAVRTYLGYLEECYLIRTVPFFRHSTKAGLDERTPRKIYSVDTALRAAVAPGGHRDRGRMAENIVANELVRRGSFIGYWQGRHEVDFVHQATDGRLAAINVCYADDIPERETEGLLELQAARGNRAARITDVMILSRGRRGSLRGVPIQPLAEWLLKRAEVPRGSGAKERGQARSSVARMVRRRGGPK